MRVAGLGVAVALACSVVGCGSGAGRGEPGATPSPSAPASSSWPTTGSPVPSLPGSTSVPAPEAADSGVTGRVTAGPVCPVEQPDRQCRETPVRVVVEARAADGSPVGRVPTDADGTFRFALAPGAYVLAVVHDGPLPRCADSTVEVDHGFTNHDISCDSGMR